MTFAVGAAVIFVRKRKILFPAHERHHLSRWGKKKKKSEAGIKYKLVYGLSG